MGRLALAGGAITELIRSRTAAAREEAARTSTREERLDDLQRETLLQLQERLAEWMRSLGEIHHADVMGLKVDGRLHILPEGVSEREFEAARRLMYLAERVRDDELRQALRDFRNHVAADQARRIVDHEDVTREALDADLVAVMKRGELVQERLGTVLRSYL